MLFQEVPDGRPFIFGGDHWTKRTGIYAKCTRTGQDHLFLQLTEIQEAYGTCATRKSPMKSLIINVTRIIVAAGILVCWGKCHGIDTHWCDFVLGWRIQAEPNDVNVAVVTGFVSRIISEIAGAIGGIIALAWVFVPSRSDHKEFCLADTMHRWFWS